MVVRRRKVGDMSVALQPTTSTIPRWRWRNGSSASGDTRFVTLGQSGDGRWYAEHSGVNVQFRFDYHDHLLAVRLVEVWIGDGQEWIETPASYDAIGHPDDGAQWVRRGGEWFPA